MVQFLLVPTNASYAWCTVTNLQLEIEQVAGAAKVDAGGQAGNLLVVGGVDIGLDIVRALHLMSEDARWKVGTDSSGDTYRRDLAGEFDGLAQHQVAGLDGALEVDVLDLLAQVGGGAEQLDEAVLDLELDVGALLDGLLHLSNSADEEFRATVILD
jgi:hypothetical protein